MVDAAVRWFALFWLRQLVVSGWVGRQRLLRAARRMKNGRLTFELGQKQRARDACGVLLVAVPVVVPVPGKGADGSVRRLGQYQVWALRALLGACAEMKLRQLSASC